jgi:ubiquinone/menaquinone biosynthesis C-methylase UbiE
MSNTILRANATPIYNFFSYINSKQSQGELGEHLKILDCGAGGPVPPLALFSEYGFDSYGMDISEEQLKLSRQYCADKGLNIDFRKADMRQIPFDDERFDCVYEHYAMCHLSKKETQTAVNEMHRVTRKGGLCFLGVISMDSWPKSLYGVEEDPGEFWADEGEDRGRHSMFTNEEADQLVNAWEILSKEKRVKYLQSSAEKITLDEWMEMYVGDGQGYPKESWRSLYDQRVNKFNYSHIYYILRKQ